MYVQWSFVNLHLHAQVFVHEKTSILICSQNGHLCMGSSAFSLNVSFASYYQIRQEERLHKSACTYLRGAVPTMQVMIVAVSTCPSTCSIYSS